MRVVFDTNIYISAFAISGGNAEDAYLEAVRGTFELYTSVTILTETARVLQTKAEFVVSGDRHLLALKRHAGITMISLADFLTKLRR